MRKLLPENGDCMPIQMGLPSPLLIENSLGRQKWVGRGEKESMFKSQYLGVPKPLLLSKENARTGQLHLPQS